MKITSSYGTDGTAFTRRFDTAETGEHGGFAGFGAVSVDGNDIGASTIKLLRKSIGTKKHPKTWLGDTSGVGKH